MIYKFIYIYICKKYIYINVSVENGYHCFLMSECMSLSSSIPLLHLSL